MRSGLVGLAARSRRHGSGIVTGSNSHGSPANTASVKYSNVDKLVVKGPQTDGTMYSRELDSISAKPFGNLNHTVDLTLTSPKVCAERSEKARKALEGSLECGWSL
jgi:hypothetical protein